MTLARLEAEMDEDEFELWKAEDLIRSDECPFCGVEPRDMMEFDYIKVHCPNCKQDYHKTRRTTPWPSSAQPPLSEGSQEATH